MPLLNRFASTDFTEGKVALPGVASRRGKRLSPCVLSAYNGCPEALLTALRRIA